MGNGGGQITGLDVQIHANRGEISLHSSSQTLIGGAANNDQMQGQVGNTGVSQQLLGLFGIVLLNASLQRILNIAGDHSIGHLTQSAIGNFSQSVHVQRIGQSLADTHIVQRAGVLGQSQTNDVVGGDSDQLGIGNTAVSNAVGIGLFQFKGHVDCASLKVHKHGGGIRVIVHRDLSCLRHGLGIPVALVAHIAGVRAGHVFLDGIGTGADGITPIIIAGRIFHCGLIYHAENSHGHVVQRRAKGLEIGNDKLLIADKLPVVPVDEGEAAGLLAVLADVAIPAPIDILTSDRIPVGEGRIIVQLYAQMGVVIVAPALC